MARVHLRCLQQWLERRRADPAVPDAAALCCEVCKAPYRLHVRERLNLTLDALCSCASLGFYAEFATILVTLAAMVALFYLFAYSQDTVSHEPHTRHAMLHRSLLYKSRMRRRPCPCAAWSYGVSYRDLIVQHRQTPSGPESGSPASVARACVRAGPSSDAASGVRWCRPAWVAWPSTSVWAWASRCSHSASSPSPR